MSDDVFESDEGKRMGGGGNLKSATSHSTGIENPDAVFSLMRNSRRRYLLYYLFAVDGDVTEYEAAVNAVCEYETTETETGDRSTREEVRIELHHDHLPRLANAEILDYDRRHGTIRFTGHPALGEWIRLVRGKELE